jgi:hypothetical protein
MKVSCHGLGTKYSFPEMSVHIGGFSVCWRDHRLMGPRGLRRGLCPRDFHMWTLVSGYVY